MGHLPRLFVAVLCLIARTATAEVINGLVIHVDDGDTVTLLVSRKEKLSIRLANIDAPERSHTKQESGRVGQPYSEISRRSLEGLAKGKDAVADCAAIDRYGRLVCDVVVDGRSVNLEQVSRGLAWANRQSNGRYLNDKTLIQVEKDARTRGLGLWADKSPVPPWEWRNLCWKQGSCNQP